MSAPLGHTTLIIPTESHLCGQRYSKVPTHISVLPWMNLTEIRGDFISGARVLCDKTEAFDLTPAGEMIVGAAGFEKTAQKFEQSSIGELHRALFSLATGLGVTFTYDQWLNHGYTPHLTNSSLPGALLVDRLTVVDNIAVEGSDRGIKTITQTLPLKDR